MLNAFRKLFKYDGDTTIHVYHAISTSMKYATIALTEDLKARATITFPEQIQQMDNIVEEVRDSLQKFANRWCFFYGSKPQALVSAFVRQQAFSRNPKNK